MGRALGHPEYLEATNKAIDMLKNDRIRILKADIFNEVTLRHPTPGGILLNLKRDRTTMELHAIEYDEKKIYIAWYMQMEHFVKVIRGDIRHLPYEDKYFDLVLDLSTLDHIQPEHIEQVFLQYNRVLKDKGLLVLFCWCADFYTYGYSGPGKDMWYFENQYFFPVDEVREKFQRYFNILEEEKGYVYMFEKMNLIGPNNNSYFMYRFLGEKKVNKNIYSYLENEIFDLRFKKALEMIGLVSGKVILDLNCGTARMLQYMPEEFLEYIGNDINEEVLEVAKKRPANGKTQFILCRDDEIINYLNKVDIFMNFGISAGVNKGIESETELETFKKIVEKFLPETIICEAWSYYEENYKVISQRGDFSKLFGYKEISSFNMKEGMDRILVVYKRN